MLFDSIVFGPISSRRLGVSLGINLLPVKGKVCSFDCVYCECGFNKDGKEDTKLATRADVKSTLTEFLTSYVKSDKDPLDYITFAGNGEPTIHPDFKGIIEDTVQLRNRFTPNTEIAVLSNAWHLDKKEVISALRMVDKNVLKLDSAIKDTILKINQPVNPKFELASLLERLSLFRGECTIQTLFFKGENIDNTTEEEVNAWISALKIIQPQEVQIYSLDRATPSEGLIKVPKEELKKIADRIKKLGFKAVVTG